MWCNVLLVNTINKKSLYDYVLILGLIVLLKHTQKKVWGACTEVRDWFVSLNNNFTLINLYK